MAPFLNHLQSAENVDDSEFREELSAACQKVYHSFWQSTYSSWEELQEGLLDSFGLWLSKCEKGANRRAVLENVAINLLIRVGRAEGAKRPGQKEISLDRHEWGLLSSGYGAEILDQPLLDECRSRLSNEDRRFFDEHFVQGASLRQIAKRENVSPNALCERWKRIVESLRPIFE